MNKYKLIIFCMFFLCVFSISKVYALVKDLPLLGRSICLDAGHGGKDSGAISNNLLEKDINLEIVKRLEKILVSKGAYVYLTREGDYDLSNNNKHRKVHDLLNRAKYINSKDIDIYISIHLNSSLNSNWKGLQIFYTKNNLKNKFLAETINNNLKEEIDNVRNIHEENSYLMYKKISKPGILIECGFISNVDDNYLLRNSNYQDKLANSITKGIIDYYKKNNNK